MRKRDKQPIQVILKAPMRAKVNYDAYGEVRHNRDIDKIIEFMNEGWSYYLAAAKNDISSGYADYLRNTYSRLRTFCNNYNLKKRGLLDEKDSIII